MFDVCDIVSLLDSGVYIVVVIAFVSAEVLFDHLWVRAVTDKGDDEIISGPFVMFVGASQMEGHRWPSFIDEQLELAALFAPSRRIAPNGVIRQRGRH